MRVIFNWSGEFSCMHSNCSKVLKYENCSNTMPLQYNMLETGTHKNAHVIPNPITFLTITFTCFILWKEYKLKNCMSC